MKHDPISDVLNFLQQPAFVSGPAWPTAVFWVLVLASLAIAVYAFAAMPGQRRATHLWNWVFRFLIGCMWWQQTLWKLPPYYTDHPDQPFGATGLAYWMGLMVSLRQFHSRPSSSTTSCCRIFTCSRRSSIRLKC